MKETSINQDQLDPLSLLPIDIKGYIISHLNPDDILHLGSTSNLFYRILNDEALWNNKLRQLLGYNPDILNLPLGKRSHPKRVYLRVVNFRYLLRTLDDNEKETTLMRLGRKEDEKCFPELFCDSIDTEKLTFGNVYNHYYAACFVGNFLLVCNLEAIHRIWLCENRSFSYGLLSGNRVLLEWFLARADDIFLFFNVRLEDVNLLNSIGRRKVAELIFEKNQHNFRSISPLANLKEKLVFSFSLPIATGELIDFCEMVYLANIEWDRLESGLLFSESWADLFLYSMYLTHCGMLFAKDPSHVWRLMFREPSYLKAQFDATFDKKAYDSWVIKAIESPKLQVEKYKYYVRTAMDKITERFLSFCATKENTRLLIRILSRVHLYDTSLIDKLAEIKDELFIQFRYLVEAAKNTEEKVLLLESALEPNTSLCKVFSSHRNISGYLVGRFFKYPKTINRIREMHNEILLSDANVYTKPNRPTI